jgi:histidinol-phosphate/aromatic aminotransferase/cobyric acid decarboxylase-like protein
MRPAATDTAIPSPGAHGGDGAAVAAALGVHPSEVLDLSLSLNPVAPDPVPVICRHAGSINRYPDPTVATRALAEVIGVDERQLLLTNGGAEAIRVVADDIGGRVVEPEFSLHPRRGGPVWRSNPHNPSGRLASADERAGVWDEAFFPLAAGRWTRGDPDALVVGSLTKLLACPGLRVGYVLAPPRFVPVLERCRRRQPEWAVNGLAAAALPDLLAPVDLVSWTDQTRHLRQRLVDLLSAHGLEPLPSDANWVVVEAPGLRARLAPHGVVVRDCSSFGLPSMVRIAVPGSDGLARLDEALRAVMRSGDGLGRPGSREAEENPHRATYSGETRAGERGAS